MNPETKRLFRRHTRTPNVMKSEFYPREPKHRRGVVTHTQENTMDKEHVKGAIDKTKGAVKDAVGGLTGDTGMQVQGKVDKAKGSVRQKVGDAKDAARDAIDKA